MHLNFYVSSGLNNVGQVRHVADMLRRHGWRQTCDWTAFDASAARTPERLQGIAQSEVEGVRAADVVIVLMPRGRGTHVELGMALALGKRVYMYHADDAFFACDDDTCAFYWLPQVRRVTGDLDAAVNEIVRENAAG